MSDERMITFKGKILDDCTREELISGIKWCMETIERQKAHRIQEIEMNELFKKTRERMQS